MLNDQPLLCFVLSMQMNNNLHECTFKINSFQNYSACHIAITSWPSSETVLYIYNYSFIQCFTPYVIVSQGCDNIQIYVVSDYFCHASPPPTQKSITLPTSPLLPSLLSTLTFPLSTTIIQWT